MLAPEERLVGAQLSRYITDELYWVLHAPRQTGKTTFLQSWARHINASDKYIACYVSLEDCQGKETTEEAMRTIYRAICYYAEVAELPVPLLDDLSPEGLLRTTLLKWSVQVAPKSLVVLFDEVDVLTGAPVIDFLRQLRGGFAIRGIGKFPTSVVLVGMRDLKDYITASKEGIAPNPGSPFNIKADSAVLSNFSQEDIKHLFAQHTTETGQEITQEALDYVWEQSKGQPWIVNNLFMRATMRVLDAESTETVSINHVYEARKQMIAARETHFDALGKRLTDPRVKHVVQTIISGDSDPQMGRMNPDVELVMDLGLVTWSSEKGFIIANPIYEEILTQQLNSGYHDSLPAPSTWKWQSADGNLDMNSLLHEFQGFWRKHADIWEQKADYTEVFPHLLLMAFLQRILNGGGRIEREFAAGRGRMDLAVEYNNQWFIIEIKILHDYDTTKEIKEEGLKQIAHYRDKIAPAAPAYLVIFDRRSETKKLPWNERIAWMEERDIAVLGC
jgi:hypothetical protein